MRKISLAPGKFARVAAEDFEYLSRFTWGFDGQYAVRYVDRHRKIYMHRELTGALPGEPVDHVNRNKLDNRRENLRLGTRAGNARNCPKRTLPLASSFKGVSPSRRSKPWRATLTWNGRQIFLGHFNSELDAASAYDEAAEKFFGEFACLNFPKLNQPTK